MLLPANTGVLKQEKESGGDRDGTQPPCWKFPHIDLRHHPNGGPPWLGTVSPAVSSCAGSKGSRRSPAPSRTCPRGFLAAPTVSGSPGSHSGHSGTRRPTAEDRPRPPPVLGARVAAPRYEPPGRHLPGRAASPGVTAVSWRMDPQRSRSAPGLPRWGVPEVAAESARGPRGNQSRPAVCYDT